MKKRKVLFVAFILLSNNLIAQSPCNNTLLYAVRPKEKKDNSLCGTYLRMDSSKFIYIHSGCEQHSFFTLDRFHLSNDSIYLDRFDFM